MSNEKSIKSASLDEIEAWEAEGKLWPTRQNAEAEALPDDFWANAEIVDYSEPKQAISLRVDRDVLNYFKQDGKGYQTRIHNVLKSYVEAQKRAS